MTEIKTICCANCKNRSGALIDKPLLGDCKLCFKYSMYSYGEKQKERWDLEKESK